MVNVIGIAESIHQIQQIVNRSNNILTSNRPVLIRQVRIGNDFNCLAFLIANISYIQAIALEQAGCFYGIQSLLVKNSPLFRYNFPGRLVHQRLRQSFAH